jgi:quercetin dioxygenase-like cupin family protein
VFDTEQIWTVLEGELSVDIAGEAQTLGTGDTVVIPAEPSRHCRRGLIYQVIVA